MANKIVLKNSQNAGVIPAAADLELGETAINTNDGHFYFKKNDGTEVLLEVRPAEVGEAVKITRTEDEPTGSFRSGDLYYKPTESKYYFRDSDTVGWASLFESMREEIAALTKNNLMPQAGYGSENIVPITGNAPNAIMAIANSQGQFLDKNGINYIFFSSKTAYGTRNLARAKVIDGNVIVDDFYTEVETGAGIESFDYIWNMDVYGCHLRSRTTGNHYLFDTTTSGSPADWTCIADLSTAQTSIPVWSTADTVIEGSAFQWCPQFQKALRFCYNRAGQAGVEIYTVNKVARTVALEHSYLVLDISTGGAQAADFGTSFVWPDTSHWASDYSIGSDFGYSYNEKRLRHIIGTYRTVDGAGTGRGYRIDFSVPDSAFTGTPPTTNLTVYKPWDDLGVSPNGVFNGGSGTTYGFAYEPFSETWSYHSNSYWSTGLGSVSWTGVAGPAGTTDWTYNTVGYSLPDLSYMSKQVSISGFAIGDTHVMLNGLSNFGGNTWRSINAPYNGTYTLEGQQNYYVQVGEAEINATSSSGIFYVDGNYYSCTGLGQPVRQWTEDPVNGWTATDIGVTCPAAIPNDGAGNTYTGVGHMLYDPGTGRFFGRAYTSLNPSPYVTVVSFDATTVTAGGMLLSDQTLSALNGGVVGTASVRGFYQMMLSGDNLYVNGCWSRGSGVTSNITAVVSKANVLAGNNHGDSVELERSSGYTGYGQQSMWSSPDGQFYVCRSTSSATAINTYAFANEAAFLASDFFGNGGGSGTRTDIAAVSAAGFTVTVESYPLFIGGFQCTLSQEALTGQANTVHYVIAAKDPLDTSSVILSLIDYLPAGLENTFDSYTQVCLSTFETDDDKIISKTDRAIVRA